MASMSSDRRSEAGSKVLERPSNNSDSSNRRTDGGNVQLMEAHLLQLYSSLRALYRSNQELAEALKVDPNDQDFAQALEENWEAMRKQRELARELVTEIKNRGIRTYDIPQDICDMTIPAWKAPRNISSIEAFKEEDGKEAEEGLYL